MHKFLKVSFLVAGLLAVLLAAFLALGFWWGGVKAKTAKAIEKIESTKITLDDVNGTYLPPKPDQALNDSTVAGIDFNNNSIRDDVELAIFEKYPNSARMRAAMLQYAQELQLQLTEVFNSETLIASIQQENVAFFCLGEVDDENLNSNKKELEELTVNNELRMKKWDEVYNYMTTYSTLQEKKCDIESSILPN